MVWLLIVSEESWWKLFGSLALNPFSAGTAFMLMQTGWIQASRQVTLRLAWDPTCLLHSPSFPIKNKHNLNVLKSRRQYNLFLENYPAFKGLTVDLIFHYKVNYFKCSYDIGLNTFNRPRWISGRASVWGMEDCGFYSWTGPTKSRKNTVPVAALLTLGIKKVSGSRSSVSL